MTQLFDQAVARVRTLPPDSQDDLARVLLRLTGADGDVYELTADELADLTLADEEIERGELATDEEVRAIFARLAT